MKYFYDYDVPNGWTDDTYGNDTCPSCVMFDYDSETWFKLFMDYPEADMREDPEQPRYTLYLYSNWREDDVNNPDYGMNAPMELLGNNHLVQSDDLQDILRFTLSRACAKVVDYVVECELKGIDYNV